MGTPIDRVVSRGFGVTGGGGARGNLATDNGGGRAETVLSNAEEAKHDAVLQTLFSHISINSSSILTVSMTPESP